VAIPPANARIDDQATVGPALTSISDACSCNESVVGRADPNLANLNNLAWVIMGGVVSGRELLRLRPLRLDDEAAFRAGHQAMAVEGFTFGFDLEPAIQWNAYLEALHAHHGGLNLAEGQVPATFLVADVAGVIAGRASIRHQLNDRLKQEGGHIGYAVLPPYRRRGYTTEILRQSLVIARANGVDRVLLTCNDDNTWSIVVIERWGGRLDSVTRGEYSAIPVRQYWID
jgi:predicted acetyltransferase